MKGGLKRWKIRRKTPDKASQSNFAIGAEEESIEKDARLLPRKTPSICSIILSCDNFHTSMDNVLLTANRTLHSDKTTHQKFSLKGEAKHLHVDENCAGALWTGFLCEKGWWQLLLVQNIICQEKTLQFRPAA